MVLDIVIVSGILIVIVTIWFAERVLTRRGSPQVSGRVQPVDHDPGLQVGGRVWAWRDGEFLLAVLVDVEVSDPSATDVPMCRVRFDHAPTQEVDLPESMIRKDSEDPPEMLPAHKWHTQRRRAITHAHPELKKITPLPTDIYTVMMVTLLLLHLGVGIIVAAYLPTDTLWLWTIVLAATVGAFCMFILQQLTHEASHIKYGRRQVAPALLADLVAGSSGPGYTIYYFKAHLPHHAKTGDEYDPDLNYHAEWANPPRWLARSRLGRFLWLTLFGLFTFEILALEHITGRVHRPRITIRNIPLLLVMLGKYGFMALTFWLGGIWCFLYFRLAAGFSLGAFGHPYGGFWLMQHAAKARNGYQPTMSYGGSRIWHWLNLGELYHVEHHDFPWIPFTRIAAVRRIAPEYYRPLHVVPSVWRLTWEWLSHTDGSPWSDIAGVLGYVEPASGKKIHRRPTPPVAPEAYS